jgi:hypothetical protein
MSFCKLEQKLIILLRRETVFSLRVILILRSRGYSQKNKDKKWKASIEQSGKYLNSKLEANIQM